MEQAALLDKRTGLTEELLLVSIQEMWPRAVGLCIRVRLAEGDIQVERQLCHQVEMLHHCANGAVRREHSLRCPSPLAAHTGFEAVLVLDVEWLTNSFGSTKHRVKAASIQV